MSLHCLAFLYYDIKDNKETLSECFKSHKNHSQITMNFKYAPHPDFAYVTNSNTTIF